MLGLRLVAANPDRFDSVVAANTLLPTGDTKLGEAFEQWRRFSRETAEFHIAGVIKSGTVTPLSEEVMDAYNAPFPDERYKEGARQFPTLVPASPDDPEAEPNRGACQALSQWQNPFLTAFSNSDPVTGGAEKYLQRFIPGAQGLDHPTVENGGHFLQGDQGEALADVVVRFWMGSSEALTINPAFKLVCRVNARPAGAGREAERFADMRRKSRATNTIGISLPD